MENQTSVQFLRTRRFLLVLPVLMLPFLLFAFWVLSGGKTFVKEQANAPGLNASLPSARFDKHEKVRDKMSFYDLAKQDSVRKRQASGTSVIQLSASVKSADPNVVLINEKMAAINKQINQPPVPNNPAIPYSASSTPAADKALTAQVDKLEAMMNAMNSSRDTDPQMAQLSKMLQQIQNIQHPELITASAVSASAKTDSLFKAIPAMIEGNQKVLQGGAVRLRLKDTILIKGQLIPGGTLAYGKATITNQRLLLDIKDIRLGNAIIPVDLSVYGLDGMRGIPAPEAELTEAAGSGAGNALQSMQLLGMDQSLVTEAAAGGIQAAKSLLSKKLRRIKVHLKNQYPILLRINH